MNRIALTSLLASVAVAAGCATDPDPTTATPADPITARDYRVLAAFPLDSGGVVELGVLPGGGIVTVENVPLGSPSPIDLLVDRQHATPLELFLALAEPGAAVPIELERAHAIASAASNARAVDGPAPMPRRLDLHVAEAQFQWNYAADCTQDGSWFDNFWQTYGWGYHWYRSTTAYEDRSPYVLTNNLQAHLCSNANPNGSFEKVFRIYRSSNENDYHCGGGSWSYILTMEVAALHRGQFRITNDEYACVYRADGFTNVGHIGSPNWRLGLTKP